MEGLKWVGTHHTYQHINPNTIHHPDIIIL